MKVYRAEEHVKFRVGVYPTYLFFTRQSHWNSEIKFLSCGAIYISSYLPRNVKLRNDPLFGYLFPCKNPECLDVDIRVWLRGL